MSSRARAAAHRARQRRSLVAAVAVLGVAGAVTFVAFNGGLPFRHGFVLRALVSQPQSLRGDSPVRIAGVDVGRVTGVVAGPRGNALVSMELSSAALPLHRDATLRVRPRMFLEGSDFVDLSPGTPGAARLRSGAVIPRSRTTTAVQAYQALSLFDAASRRSLSSTVSAFARGLSGEGGMQLRLAAPQLAPLLRSSARVARSVRGQARDDLSRFVSSAAAVSATLAARRQQLAGLLTSLRIVSGTLAADAQPLQRTLGEVDGLLQQAPGQMGRIAVALPQVAALGRQLTPGLRVAPPLVDKVTSAVAELGALVAPAERARLLLALRAAFVDLPTLVHNLGGLFLAIKPVTDCVRTHLAPIFQATVPDGSLSTGQPVWQEFAHTLVGLISSSQDFDANGYYLRIEAGAGLESATALLPGLGKFVGTLPGSGPLLGARPQWVGDLTPAAFHPEANCATQPLPSLASSTAPPDVHAAGPARPLAGAPNGLRQLLTVPGNGKR